MKCPRCWAHKAYLHRFRDWRGMLLGCFGFRPMKCHHCFHHFVVHWLQTLGKRVEPPVLRVTPQRPKAASDPPRRQLAPRERDSRQETPCRRAA